jgi:holin-like protein
MTVTALGWAAARVLPLPIPASIYGIIFMFLLLCFRVIKLSQVKQASDFFLGIMPILFVPIIVNIKDIYGDISGVLLPILIFIPVSTATVMIAVGKTAQTLLKSDGEEK